MKLRSGRVIIYDNKSSLSSIPQNNGENLSIIQFWKYTTDTIFDILQKLSPVKYNKNIYEA